MNPIEPAGVIHIKVNGQPQTVAAGLTVADLLLALGVRTELVAVEVNLDIVPKPAHAQTVVQDGDQVEVVTLVGGG